MAPTVSAARAKSKESRVGRQRAATARGLVVVLVPSAFVCLALIGCATPSGLPTSYMASVPATDDANDESSATADAAPNGDAKTDDKQTPSSQTAPEAFWQLRDEWGSAPAASWGQTASAPTTQNPSEAPAPQLAVPPPAPAAQSNNSAPFANDGSVQYWASFDPAPLTQPVPSGSSVPPAPAQKDKANANGDDKPDKANGNDKKDDKKDADDKGKADEQANLLPKGWNIHAQTTVMQDFQPGIGALYSGPNSLGTQKDREGTITADLFLGAPLWEGAELHADILMWQGFGLSNSFGLEAFPNGDAYKAGTDTPRFMMSNFFIRQTIGLGGEQEDVADGQFTLPGKRDISRLTIVAGRLNVASLFDNNTYNHDPHTQFMSWASTNLSWDYPADTIGFTTGFALELNQKDWALRYGWFQLPGLPNGFTADDRIFMWPVEPGEVTSSGDFWKEWGMITEFERRWRICDHPGAVRLQAWIDHGLLADYNAATTFLVANPPPANTPGGVQVTVPQSAYSFRSKYGFGMNWEQEIAKNVGLFSRLGWQDGETAAAAFTDVDWTAQLGISVKMAAWHRPNDTFAFLGNLAGASSDQIAFLKAGGTGILNGDGNLTYAVEKSLETYYDIAIGNGCRLAFDYQFFADPAFNSDRGPVSVFGIRLHWEI